jgi:hypothetical protein
MFEGWIIGEVGSGPGIMADPSFEVGHIYEIEEQDVTLITAVKLREAGRNTFRAEARYQWHPQVRFQAQFFNSPSERTFDYRRSDTIQVGTRIDMNLATLTADYSPDAFNAGQRTRFGVQADHNITDKIKVWGWATTRYFNDRDIWDEEYDVRVDYTWRPGLSVGVRYLQSDFWDDAVTMRVTAATF